MTILVLAFAQARDALGAGSVRIDMPDGSRVTDAIDVLEARHPRLAALRPHLAVAVDRELAPGDRALSEGMELALLPPVSGG
jgi:molybdopterin converting factor small subunit